MTKEVGGKVGAMEVEGECFKNRQMGIPCGAFKE